MSLHIYHSSASDTIFVGLQKLIALLQVHLSFMTVDVKEM